MKHWKILGYAVLLAGLQLLASTLLAYFDKAATISNPKFYVLNYAVSFTISLAVFFIIGLTEQLQPYLKSLWICAGSWLMNLLVLLTFYFSFDVFGYTYELIIFDLLLSSLSIFLGTYLGVSFHKFYASRVSGT